MTRELSTLVATGVAVALLAGCGGDDAPIEPIEPSGEQTTETDAPKRTNKRLFITTADSRCAEANVAIGNIPAGDGLSVASASAQERAITAGVLAALEDLDPPADPNGNLQRFLDALDQQVTLLERREDAAEAGETATVDSTGVELTAAKAEAAVAAEQFGFEECGQEAAPLPDTVDGAGDGGGATGGTEAPAPAPTPDPPAPAPAGPGDGGDGGGDSGGDGSSGGISPG